MGLFDTVIVDAFSADFQTKQLGEDMLRYRLGEDRRLVGPLQRRGGLPRPGPPSKSGYPLPKQSQLEDSGTGRGARRCQNAAPCVVAG
jgi:hypothetical protein